VTRLWEAVQERTSRRVWRRQPVEQHRLHQRIRNEVAEVHRRLCAPAKLRSLLAMRAQEIATGNVGDREMPRELKGLRALTRSGTAEQQDEFGRAHGQSMGVAANSRHTQPGGFSVRQPQTVPSPRYLLGLAQAVYGSAPVTYLVAFAIPPARVGGGLPVGGWRHAEPGRMMPACLARYGGHNG
jgi:hypothetical protein